MGGIKAASQMSPADDTGGKAGLKRAGRNKRNCYLLLLFCCPFISSGQERQRFNDAFLFAATLVIPAGGQWRELLGARPAY